MQLEIKAVWIPFEVGGRKFVPQAGFRCGIRWMRHIDETLTRYRDVLIVSNTEIENGLYQLACELIAADIPAAWLDKGQGVELLEGFKVIAVGQIA